MTCCEVPVPNRGRVKSARSSLEEIRFHSSPDSSAELAQGAKGRDSHHLQEWHKGLFRSLIGAPKPTKACHHPQVPPCALRMGEAGGCPLSWLLLLSFSFSCAVTTRRPHFLSMGASGVYNSPLPTVSSVASLVTCPAFSAPLMSCCCCSLRAFTS